MDEHDSHARVDRASIEVDATPDAVYRAIADPVALMKWLPPESMTGRVLEYDFREGGRYRIELTYDDATASSIGKTTDRTDVSAGRFVTLEPGRRVIQSVAFESFDAATRGVMTMTWSFEPSGAGTKITVEAEDVPESISQANHEAGILSSLENLARHVGRSR